MITGATGFVGSNIAMQLLRQDAVRLYCLVRPLANRSGKARFFEALGEAFGLSNLPRESSEKSADRICVLEGDLCKPGLGLSPEDRARLEQANIKKIWHTAALVHLHPAHREQVFRTNIGGTKAVIETAKYLSVSDVFHFSTAYVAGAKKGHIEIGPCDNSAEANNPYEESKRECERLLAEASSAGQFRVQIFRPSIIIGHSQTYATTSETGLYGFMKAVKQLEAWVHDRVPDYWPRHRLSMWNENDGSALNLIPIDIVTEEAIRLATENEAQPLVYHHLTNPRDVRVSTIINEFNRHTAQIKTDIVFSKRSMNTIDSVFDSKVDFFGPYLKNGKTFASSIRANGYGDRLALGDATLEKHVGTYFQALYQKSARLEASVLNVVSKLVPTTIPDGDGSHLTYYRLGTDPSKPSIVLVNAYGVSFQIWRLFLYGFVKDFNVVTWEMRGLGSQASNGNLFGIPEHTADLKRIVDHAQIERAHLIAWCSGAKPALNFSHQFPHRVSSLICLAGNFNTLDGRKDLYTDFDKRLLVLHQLLRDAPDKARLLLETIKRSITDTTGQDAEEEQNVLGLIQMISSKYREMILGPFLSESTIRDYVNMVSDTYSYELTEQYQIQDIPTLLISAENDVIANPATAELVAQRMLGAKYICLPGVSHWFMLESYEEVSTEVKQFYKFLEHR